ncbi:hypothetical protein MUP01_04980 [Candidatus Bathyarchaeota archaeon]|nr:hypothetical protein [Candidatus Bathyarchaeota archaeon]
MAEAIEGLAQSKEELVQKFAELNKPISLEELHKIFDKWLELSNDNDFLDVILAARCDRKILGDPVWLFAISNSGGTKTEIIRALKADDVYTLDSLTSHTFVSGKIGVNEEGEIEKVRGILPQIDGKVLIIKDFTVILSKREEERSEIFAQLRALHDGYLEFAYGTTPEAVRVHASIGVVAASTPAIDMYGKLSTLLGERFLKIRHTTKPKESARKAAKNLGYEIGMREEILNATQKFISKLEFPDITIKEEQLEKIIELAYATAILRTPVMIRFWRYEDNEGTTPNIEYPTRLTKQYCKLTKLLANIRGHSEITEEDMATIKRVAKDTCVPNRVKILEFMLKKKRQYVTREIAEGSKMPLSTCWRDLKELEYLDVVDYEKVEESASSLGAMKHKPEKDGWTVKEPEIFASLFNDEVIIQNSLFHELQKGRVKGKGSIEKNRYPLVLCETESNLGIPCPYCKAKGKPMFFATDHDLKCHVSAFHYSEDS